MSTTPSYEILLSVRLTSTCPHGKRSNTCCGNAEWLQVIHTINKEHQANYPGAEQYIGTPTSTYEQSGGRWFEEYTEFRVILGSDAEGLTNYVQAKTLKAVDSLRVAVLLVTGRDVDQNGQTV